MFRSIHLPKVARSFATSPARLVSIGDKIPKVPLYEDTPGNIINLSEEVSQGKVVVVGLPGAFSPSCLASHVPGYLKKYHEFKKKGVDAVYVISVNDPFVTKAWSDALQNKNRIRFLADPTGQFSEKWDVLFDATKFFGNSRSKRYAVILQDGKVVKTYVEPDNTSVDVSSAEKIEKDI